MASGEQDRQARLGVERALMRAAVDAHEAAIVAEREAGAARRVALTRWHAAKAAYTAEQRGER